MEEPTPQTVSLTRRRFLTLSAVGAGLSVLPASVSAASRRDSGLVWTHREDSLGTRYWTDIVPGSEAPFVLCGYDITDSEHTVVRTTDRWGRVRSQRRGPEWGDGSSALVAHDDGYLLAGIDENAPLLMGFPDPSASEFLVPDWRMTYDGTPDGPVYATTADTGHAIGWTDTAETAGAVVVGTDATGTARWTDRLRDSRRMVELIAAPQSAGSVIAVGTHDGDATDGWATVWRSDGTRHRDRSLETPDEPSAAVADGPAVVVAGTNENGDGVWLQRRTADWTVEWTHSYAAGGSNLDLDDLVVHAGGYGLLAHDADGTLLVSSDESGTERWRGRYTPYSKQTGGGAPVRGRAMIPVEGDEFVVAGSTAAGAEGRDAWVARVGDPEVATPAAVPTLTPSPTPHGPLTPTPSPTITTPDDRPTPSPATPSPTDTPGEDGAGLGLLSALAGVCGWLVLRRHSR